MTVRTSAVILLESEPKFSDPFRNFPSFKRKRESGWYLEGRRAGFPPEACGNGNGRPWKSTIANIRIISKVVRAYSFVLTAKLPV